MTKPLFCKKSRPEELAISLILRGSGKPVDGLAPRRGVPIILISHNMPHVFEVADRIHVHRLGKRLCVIDPKKHSMSDAVALMTGAKQPPAGTVV